MIILSKRTITKDDLSKLSYINDVDLNGIKRMVRKQIWVAVSVYDDKIGIGEVTLSQTELQSYFSWKQKLRDLDDSAFKNIPDFILTELNKNTK